MWYLFDDDDDDDGILSHVNKNIIHSFIIT